MVATLDTKSGKGRVGSTSALLVLERFRRTDALTSAQASIAEMENALTPNNTSPTAQTLSPRYDPIPIAPKRGLILVLGGLMLGVFLALLLNAFRKQPT